MKHLCFNKIVLFILLLAVNSFALNVAFYYDEDAPEELLKAYDWIVVQPYSVDNETLLKYKNKLFVYISINEIDEGNPENISKKWIIGQNKLWNSKIADIRDKEYQDYLLKKLINFSKKGFQNFFFDTLDSYKIAVKENEWKECEISLINFIKKVKKALPNSKIILNRGFEIIDKVSTDIDAVAAESLFYGYDGQRYFKVSETDRNHLLNELRKIQSYKLPVIVIDYIKPEKFDLAKKIAKKIKELGFIPYITVKDLSIIGVSDIEIFKRKILVIYQSKFDVAYSNAHRLLQMPIEGLGYIADLKTPDEALKIKYTFDRYAGIVVYLEQDILKDFEKFHKWILDRIKNHNKILFLDYFGFPLQNKYLSPLNLKIEENLSPSFENLEYKYVDKALANFETEPPAIVHTTELITSLKGTPVIELTNSHNQKHQPVVITDWGGYILENFSYLEFNSYKNNYNFIKWVINPFRILTKTLRLQTYPSPDFTTENGMRVLISHIDGDGAVSLSEINPEKFASEVIKDEILKKYKIPIGVSFIEGEIMPYGAYPQYSKKAINVAKSIFALPNVEPASHTFSHPYKWLKIFALAQEIDSIIPDDYNMEIPNYSFNLEREILGSIENLSKLSPKNKPIKIIYWSGNCIPPEEGLKLAYEHGHLNINGGDTFITKDKPFISLISPTGLKRGKYYQIYAAAQNENVYTDGFSRNYWRYKKAIETFQLTDKPIRLKPIDIYYHFYSGAKLASLNAVKDVYNWALKQEIIPLKVSEYIKKVLDFYNTTVIKKEDKWIIKTDGNIRTLRIDKSLGYPDLSLSKGVLGFYEYNNHRYIHLDGSGRYELVLNENPPKRFYLSQSNGRVISKKDNLYNFKSYQPLKVKFANLKKCKVKSKDRYFIKNNTYQFDKKEVTFKVECK